MATIDIWIQLENRPWDCCPNGIDRMTGTDFPSIGVLNGGDQIKAGCGIHGPFMHGTITIV